MTNKRLSVIAGVVGASALAAAPALTAAAYPPNKQLLVHASQPSASTIRVDLTNTQAGCTYIAQSRGVKERTTASGTTASIDLPIGTKTGNYVVNVRSFGCSGPTETGQDKIGVTKFKATGAKSVKVGESFAVSAAGWSPDSPVTFVLTGGGKTITSKDVTPNEDGDAGYKFTAPTVAGTYAVTVIQGSASQSYTLVVSGKVPQVGPKPKPKPKPVPKPKPKPVPKPKPKPVPKPKPKGH